MDTFGQTTPVKNQPLPFSPCCLLFVGVKMDVTPVPSVRVAVVQAEPVYFDLEGSVEKTIKLISEAASKSAKLVAFPEVWIPGYPSWIW